MKLTWSLLTSLLKVRVQNSSQNSFTLPTLFQAERISCGCHIVKMWTFLGLFVQSVWLNNERFLWQCQPNDKEEVKGHGKLLFVVSFGWTGGSYSTSLACQQPSGQTTQNMKIKRSFLLSCSYPNLKHLVHRVATNSQSRVPSEMISCSIKTKAKWQTNMFFLKKKM